MSDYEHLDRLKKDADTAAKLGYDVINLGSFLFSWLFLFFFSVWVTIELFDIEGELSGRMALLLAVISFLFCCWVTNGIMKANESRRD